MDSSSGPEMGTSLHCDAVMRHPCNGLYTIQGEISLILMAMRKSSRWTLPSQRDDTDPLLGNFKWLKDVLNSASDLHEIKPNAFLSPFLEVIRSEDTSGPITGLALASINKFLLYGLVDPESDGVSVAIENIADAITHTRFVGTDPASDEVVLMKILHVLQTLLLCPAGALLTDEAVCEIMQSCFRICFEMRLSELLRKSAEHTLMNMVQLLFSRLPQFKEDPNWVANMKKLKMRTGGVDQASVGRRKKSSAKPKAKKSKVATASITSQVPESLTTVPHADTCLRETLFKSEPDLTADHIDKIDHKTEHSTSINTGKDYNKLDLSEKIVQTSETADIKAGYIVVNSELVQDGCLSDSRDRPHMPFQERVFIEDGVDQQRTQSIADFKDHISLAIPADDNLVRSSSEVSLPQSEVGDEESCYFQHSNADTSELSDRNNDFVNVTRVKCGLHQQHHRDALGLSIPYGLPCIRELFRFLISLTNPMDRHNTDVMIYMGLSLLTIALETGADQIGKCTSLMYLVKDDMCRFLFMLVHSERLSLCAAALGLCFLMFESLRSHLKLQLEMYLTKLSEIITSDHPRIMYDVKELALESIVQLWRIPGFITELYLNYDCNLFCTNLFEDLTKLLSKNAFSMSGLFSTHLLSLEALLTVVDSIEQHCCIIKSANSKEEVGKVVVGHSNGNGEEDIGLSKDGKEDRAAASAMSGLAAAQRVTKGSEVTDSSKSTKSNEPRKVGIIKPNRMPVKGILPTSSELLTLKQRKRMYHTGTEYFNQKPIKGIAYLQEQGWLTDPLDIGEIITFMKENPRIDKKVLGEYIGRRSNGQLLEAFVKSFHFEGLRIDEALRQYLETFRLPGEAPVISTIMEQFANHWHKSNGEPFANADAAFTLAYAVIILNVDQHNHNVKKQSVPMTVEEFKKNLAKTNGGEDFDGDMLSEIYIAIKNEEIVMPSEHTGIVRDNYLWKILLKRGNTMDGLFVHTPNGAYDHDLFTLVWGPTVAALSFVFDKSSDETIITNAISSFRKCAMISAYYGMTDVFDNLVISLCKFTTLLNLAESPEHLPISFGTNMKAQLCARTVFSLVYRYGDILREGWKNVLDCMLQLYRAELLPKGMIEVEDFVHPSLKISLIKECTAVVLSQRSDSGVLSSFVSYFTMSDPAASKAPSHDEEEAIRQATKCIQDCQIEQVIFESRCLREEAVHELIKALINASQGPEYHMTMGTVYDKDAAVFFFEQFISCVLQNRDRIAPFWQSIRDHICNLIVNATEHTFMVERAVVGLLRISIRLLGREEIVPQVLTSLQILLMMKPQVIHSVPICEQISFGLHELIQTNAENIISHQDWYIVFVLLEVVGAGINPPTMLQLNSGVDVSDRLMESEAQSDSEVPSTSSSSIVLGASSNKGYTSDSELEIHKKMAQPDHDMQPVAGMDTWMVVNRDEHDKKLPLVNQYSIELSEPVQACNIKSLIKTTEALSFLVQDAGRITVANFQSCVYAIRIFAEASVNGGYRKAAIPPKPLQDSKIKPKQSKSHSVLKKSQNSPSHLQMTTSLDEETEAEGLDGELLAQSIQLLDMMHTLHTRANSIYLSCTCPGDNKTASNERSVGGTKMLWIKCWCPLLQGIARLCCDSRRQVRGQALTYLQRALLVHDLQILSAAEWETCFNKILFPLLTKLLENINANDPSGMEETRMRASTLLCKVFLQHLTPLLSLSTFTALWLTILDFMDKYMHADRSDLLEEAIPESLKNMLLVMNTADIFETGDGTTSRLWNLTWDRISTFLPHLKDELFRSTDHEPSQLAMDREETPTREQESLPLLPVGDNDGKAAPDVSSSPAHTTSQSAAEPVGGKKIGCLEVHEELSNAASYSLHSPLPSIPNSSLATIASDALDRSSSSKPMSSFTRTQSDPIQSSPALPLVLNPELMQDSCTQLLSSQEHMASPFSEATQQVASQ